MKNITKQYKDLLEGKLSKANFMRNARMEFPQWISPVNSFKDAINILKSKKILSESHEGHDKWMEDMQSTVLDILDGMLTAGDITEYQKERAEYALEHYQFKEGDDPIKVAKELVFVSQHPDDDEIQAQADREERGQQDVLGQWDLEEVTDPETISNVQSAINSGKMDPKAVKAAAEKAEKGDSTELAQLMVQAMTLKENDSYSRVNTYQLEKGTEFELLKMSEITDENYAKAKEKAFKKLKKDPKAYLDLLVTNVADVEKTDKDLRDKPVKGGSLVDKANQMQKAKVQKLKESILDEMIELGEPKKKFSKGQRVKTPDGMMGVVEDATQDGTLTLNMEDGSMVDYQQNVLKPVEDKMQMREDEPDELPVERMPEETAAEDVANELATKLDQEGVMAYTKRQLDDAFRDYQDSIGQHLDNEVFQQVIRNLKAMGYTMTFKEDKHASLKEKLAKAIKKELDEAGDVVTDSSGNFLTSTKPGKGRVVQQRLKQSGINAQIIPNVT